MDMKWILALGAAGYLYWNSKNNSTVVVNAPAPTVFPTAAPTASNFPVLASGETSTVAAWSPATGTWVNTFAYSGQNASITDPTTGNPTSGQTVIVDSQFPLFAVMNASGQISTFANTVSLAPPAAGSNIQSNTDAAAQAIAASLAPGSINTVASLTPVNLATASAPVTPAVGTVVTNLSAALPAASAGQWTCPSGQTPDPTQIAAAAAGQAYTQACLASTQAALNAGNTTPTLTVVNIAPASPVAAATPVIAGSENYPPWGSSGPELMSLSGLGRASLPARRAGGQFMAHKILNARKGSWFRT